MWEDNGHNTQPHSEAKYKGDVVVGMYRSDSPEECRSQAGEQVSAREKADGLAVEVVADQQPVVWKPFMRKQTLSIGGVLVLRYVFSVQLFTVWRRWTLRVTSEVT